MHENLGKSFFLFTDKNMNSFHVEWCIGIYPSLCTIFFKTSIIWYLKFMLYHAAIQIFFILLTFSILMPKCSALVILKGLSSDVDSKQVQFLVEGQFQFKSRFVVTRNKIVFINYRIFPIKRPSPNKRPPCLFSKVNK